MKKLISVNRSKNKICPNIEDLSENDTIILYTDGVTEAKNEQFEDFGDQHFLKVLQSNRQLNAEELSNKIIHEISVFSSSHEQYDDITLVIFKWQKNKN